MRKKLLSALVICALTTAVPLTSEAGMQLFNDSKVDSLMKRLEEKGLLTKEEIEQIKEEDKKSQKGHSLKAGVRLQFRYEHKEGTATGERDDDFNIRRLRIDFQGNMWPEVAYKFEVAADKMDDLAMKDASLTFKHLGPYAHLRIGQYKTPFSRQRIVSSSKLQMIDRSPVQILYPGRDTGIELSGKNICDVLDYAVAVEAGVGDRRKFSKADTSEFWYDGRVAFHPLGEVPLSEGDNAYTDNFRFEVAGNALYAPGQVAFGERSINDMFLADSAYGLGSTLKYLDALKADDDSMATTEIGNLPQGLIGDTFIWGPELTIRYKGISLATEYYFASYTPNDTKTYRKLYTQGYFVQAGAFIMPKLLELTARYDRLDRDTERTTQDDTREYAVGVNYFPYEDHRYKLQANYIVRREDFNEINNDSLVLNLQVQY